MAEPVISPVGESRPTLKIFQDLAARLGFTEDVFSLPDGQPLRDPDDKGGYPLEFITSPHHLFLNSAFNEIDRLREKAGQARVMIHPQTARARGIAHGDPVRVFNDRGECRFIAHVTDNTQTGLLVAEGLHWPSLSPGGGANQLTSQRLTDMGNTCAFHCNRVEIRLWGDDAHARNSRIGA